MIKRLLSSLGMLHDSKLVNHDTVVSIKYVTKYKKCGNQKVCY